MSVEGVTMNVSRKDESSSHLAAWTVYPTSSRTAVEDAPLATAFTEGSKHCIRHANSAFGLITSQAPRALVNRDLDTVLVGREFRDLFDRVFETGIPNVLSDVPWGNSSDRAERYLTVIARPIASEITESRGLLVEILDTTEQVIARMTHERIAADARLANEALVVAGLREQAAAEAALREKQSWSALIENLAEGVAVLDRVGHPILVNPVGRMLLDMEDELLDDCNARALHTTAGVVLPPERYPARRALAGERFADEEFVFHRQDGFHRRLLVSGTSVRDEGGAVALAINTYRDVTALRVLEETREEYVALISHDLRNPLHTLLLNSQILVERMDAGERDVSDAEIRCVQGITKTARRLAAMVDELYESSELESGRLQLRKTSTAPAWLVTDLLDEFADPKERARLIVVERAHDLPAVHVNVPRIQRALANLITNALKYSAPSSQVRVELDCTSAEVTFAVHDAGPGIGADDLRHVFEKYHRSRATSARDGMGLGLYITKRIVEAHGGRVSAESVIRQGSTFRIALPLVGGVDRTP